MAAPAIFLKKVVELAGGLYAKIVHGKLGMRRKQNRHSVNPQEGSNNSFKIVICHCRIKDHQVLLCKTYNWITIILR